MTLTPTERLFTVNAPEIVTGDELRALLARRDPVPRGYIGFEPSGIAHIGWKICANKVRDLTDCGVEMVIFLADWHAQINDKYGGSLEAIRTCAAYMEEVFRALGIDSSKTRFLLASDVVSKTSYWARVIQVAKETSLSRVKRALTIMGRKEEEAELDASKTIYPLMQVADIFEIPVDLALGGMDQRKAHMLMRDVAPKLGLKPAVAFHTPLLTSLRGHADGRMNPATRIGIHKSAGGITSEVPPMNEEEITDAKMSKSSPDGAIFVHDTPEEIGRKLDQAFCPAGTVEGNPVLDIAEYVLLAEQPELRIERPAKYGGDLVLHSAAELHDAFTKKTLHPKDLKTAVARGLAESLTPVRTYFDRHPEHLATVRALKVTR